MQIIINLNGSTILNDSMTRLRDVWEATSFQLERLQTNQACVVEEEALLKNRKAPPYKLTFDPQPATPVQETSECTMLLKFSYKNMSLPWQIIKLVPNI